MEKIYKGALAGAGAALAVIAVMGVGRHVMANSIANITLDRRFGVEPSMRVKKLVSGCNEIEVIEGICRNNAYRLEQGDCKTVVIRAHDGERLVGHLHICPNALRTVIAMHGWRTTWSRDFGSVSEFFHNNRCNVLYAEQRGQNNSGGAYMGFGIIERYDCLEWVRYLNRISKKTLPIYLCGVSMGATTVLMTTGFNLPSNVVGVVADCGFTSPAAIWEHVVRKNLHVHYGRINARDVRSVCKRRMHIDPEEYSTLDALKNCKVPVLFVHGAKDRFVPYDMTLQNYCACASEKKLFTVPDADHGMSYFTDREGYEAAILSFWRDCDIRI